MFLEKKLNKLRFVVLLSSKLRTKRRTERNDDGPHEQVDLLQQVCMLVSTSSCNKAQMIDILGGSKHSHLGVITMAIN